MDAIARFESGQYCSVSGRCHLLKGEANSLLDINTNRRIPVRKFKLEHGRRRNVRNSAARKSCQGQRTLSSRNGLGGIAKGISDFDLTHLQHATRLADSSAGLTAPHPNAGCVLVDDQGRVIAETHQRAQGSESVEVQAARLGGPAARGSTAYLNLETGDCHGDDTSLRALIDCGVERVVVGLQNPLRHTRGLAIKELRQAGLHVDVLKQSVSFGDPDQEQETWQACLDVNEALLHRAVSGKPLGILKYAMTLDGKIATSTGHSAWVTAPTSRARVFETRSRSDAVIVGGQTVRRDNPRLTTRQESGHAPVRIVMSRTLDLPPDANLWDVSSAPTIVMTQRGARRDFQAHLLARGVEVVQFDFLTPHAVAAYCSERGFLQCLWECGGTLAAPAIAGGVIHKCLAFVAPKLIGGVRAPSPVGELGNVEMTQATELSKTKWECIGRDMLLTGYLPSSLGPAALNSELDEPSASQRAPPQDVGPSGNVRATLSEGALMPTPKPQKQIKAIEFYKAWDRYGTLSNFSPHPVMMPESMQPRGGQAQNGSGGAPMRRWQTLEHYYQAQKFAGVEEPEARQLVEQIMAAGSPEEAALLGRGAQRTHPHLVAPNWETAKLFVMYAGLQAKFSQHAGPRASLLATARGKDGQPQDLVEAAPHDFFWGRGVDNSGANHLGVLLMKVRAELLQAESSVDAREIASVRPHGLQSIVTAIN